MMRRIVLLAPNGQVGFELQRSLAPLGQLFCLSRSDVDFRDTAATSARVLALQPDLIVNAAAWTAVDKAETDSDNAYKINRDAVGLLATVCKEHGCKFVHISTDFVFEGNQAYPLKEDDAVNPTGVYGDSKLAGEELALRNNPDTLIIRTSWVYSLFGNNFVKSILRLCKERESLNVVFDQVGTPTYARDLAQAIIDIIQQPDWKPGIYHYSNEGVASWYDFAVAIRDIAGLKTKLGPIESYQYPTPAVRPKYSVLNKKKFKDTFGIQIPYWRDSLVACMDSLK